MTSAGLIFSNIHDKSIPELTARRTVASLPFAGKYRLVDFSLSNMVNAGINKVGIITHNNYRSLIDHIGNGKDWDLARRSGGVLILPPFIASFDNPRATNLYRTRLEALMGAMDFLKHCDEDVIVLSDCNTVCNVDISKVVDYHEETNATVTIVTAPHSSADAFASDSGYVVYDENNVISAFPFGNTAKNSDYDINTNIFVINREFLISLVEDSVETGYSRLYSEALSAHLGEEKFVAYRYDGYFKEISSLNAFYSINMESLAPEVREELFANNDRPIFTKVRNSAPASYGADAKVSNSLIADGCIIEGTVENSVIFRGVHIGKDTVVKNCVILQDSDIGRNVSLNCVIADKDVVIRDDRQLSGAEIMPFFIAKGKTV